MAALSPSPRPDRETIRAISRAAFERAEQPGAGKVSVRAYRRIRNGQRENVGAHERGGPPGGDDPALVLAMAPRRPGPPDDPRGRGQPLEGAGAQVNRGSGAASSAPPRRSEARQGNLASAASPEPLTTILAPGGKPIGTSRGGARPAIRTLPGGEPAARQMFQRLIEGRGGVDATPAGYPGQIIRLPDGSRIGYRPVSRSEDPAVDINITGFPLVKRLHF